MSDTPKMKRLSEDDIRELFEEYFIGDAPVTRRGLEKDAEGNYTFMTACSSWRTFLYAFNKAQDKLDDSIVDKQGTVVCEACLDRDCKNATCTQEFIDAHNRRVK
jgi:hypothetical protein